MKPHVHAAEIKAWADGAQIQMQLDNSAWTDDEDPCWNDAGFKFRIKPEPKPDVISYVYADKGKWMTFSETHHKDHNLKLTFDGETGKLKTAKVLV